MWTNEDWQIVEAIFGFIAFIALMQLFPICIRLGQIRNELIKKTDKALPDVPKETWGETIAQQQAKM